MILIMSVLTGFSIVSAFCAFWSMAVAGRREANAKRSAERATAILDIILQKRHGITPQPGRYARN